MSTSPRPAALLALSLLASPAIGQVCEPTWHTFGDALAPDNFIRTLAMFDLGDGPQVAATGYFMSFAGSPTQRLAAWIGDTWAPIGGGIGDTPFVSSPQALASGDLGQGPMLFVGGGIASVAPGEFGETLNPNSVAAWNGAFWSDLDGGIPIASVIALEIFDDGSGPQLAVAGLFSDFPLGSGCQSIAAWDGESWRPLGEGLYSNVLALASIPNESGSTLYAGGKFVLSGSTPISRVAKWNGDSWEPLGGGLSANVYALGVLDAGDGPALYAGGDFGSEVGGQFLSRIGRWDGEAWRPLGSGVNGRIYSMVQGEVDGKPVLWIGGAFQRANPNLNSPFLIGWNGVTWIRPLSPPNGTVASLAWDGQSLWLCGNFSEVGGQSSEYLARLDACALVCAGDANGDTLVDFADLVIIVDSINSSGAGLPGDVDYDGDVDFADLNLVLSVFNTEC